jgi:hypothetical protein
MTVRRNSRNVKYVHFCTSSSSGTVVYYRAVVVVTGADVGHANLTERSVAHPVGGHFEGQYVVVANIGPQEQGWVTTSSTTQSGVGSQGGVKVA